MSVNDMFPLCIHRPAGGDEYGERELPDRLFVAVNDDEFPEYVDVERGYAGLGTKEKRRYVPERTCRGEFHQSSDLSTGRIPLYHCKNRNKSIFVEREAEACPLCGARIEASE